MSASAGAKGATPGASFPSRRAALLFLLPLIFVCFFGSLIVAAYYFPHGYDWRYRVISNLLSPRDDPDFYRAPSVGIALAAALMWPLFGYFRNGLAAGYPRAARYGSWAFRSGALALFIAALVVPQHVHPVFGLKRAHEAFARGSAILFVVGMLVCCWCGWQDRKARSTERTLDGRLLPVWSMLTLLPLAGILVSEVLLGISRLWPSWGAPIREAMRHSVFWHLGFWEWAGAGAVYLFFVSSALWLPERPSRGPA